MLFAPPTPAPARPAMPAQVEPPAPVVPISEPISAPAAEEPTSIELPTARVAIEPPAPLIPAAPVAVEEVPAAVEEAPAPAPVAPAAPKREGMIDLDLAPIVRALPSTFLASPGIASAIPDDVRVALPLAQITPQLAHGRVSIPRSVFEAGLPEAHRGIFAAGDEPAEIPIPLQEIFQNLPTGVLTHREDQVVEELGPVIPTPFSQKAEEDAMAIRAAANPPAPAEAQDAPAAESAATAVEAPELAAPAEDIVELDFGHEAASQSEAPAASEEGSASATLVPATTHDSGNEPPAFVMPSLTILPVATLEPAPTTPAEPAESMPVEATAQPEAVAQTPAAEEDRPAATPAPEPVEASDTHGSQATAMLPSAFAPVEPSPAPAKAPEPEAPAAENEPAPAPAAFDATRQERLDAAQDALREVFMIDEEFDAKKVVKLASQLPGIKACTIMFTDGLKLAGNFSADQESEGFCAMAPAFFLKARTFTKELQLGELNDLTIHTERGLLMSFFMHDDICVSVSHSGRGFLPGVREKLQAVTRQVAALYSTKD